MTRIIGLLIVLFSVSFCIAEETERTWTTVNGGKMVGVWDQSDESDQTVVYLKKGNKRYKIAVEKLIQADQDYIADARKKIQSTEPSGPPKDFEEVPVVSPPVIPPEITRPGKIPGQRCVINLNGLEFAFRWCPPGKFMMGSPRSEEKRFDNETQHEVTLTKGFWLLETEVTQKMYESVAGENPSAFSKEGKSYEDVGGMNTADFPVEMVSWYDAKEFCRKLSTLVGNVTFTLPTEAQWEYACRAGTTTPFHFGTQLNGDRANCNGNYPYLMRLGKYLERTTAVKSYAPNAWGLYDMHGNVSEWCEDWWGDYPSGSVTDPRGPNSGSGRVFRGGSWIGIAEYCRSAARNWYDPVNRDYFLGFRLALSSTR